VGDVGICISCHGVFQMVTPKTAAVMSDDEIVDLPADILQTLAKSEAILGSIKL
jgi:hypothetical protein